MKVQLHSENGENFLDFYCPGCRRLHMVRLGGDVVPRWDWNGDHEKPTLYPSVLNWEGETEEDMRDIGRCHLFLTDGRLQYLDDTDHHLAGERVPLTEIPHEALT